MNFLPDSIRYHPRVNGWRRVRSWRAQSRRLREKIAGIEAVHAMRAKHAPSEAVVEDIESETMDDLRGLSEDANRFDRWAEVDPLLEKAARLGIDIPKHWFYNTDDRYAMSHENAIKLKALIAEKRFPYRIGWATLIIAVVTLLATLWFGWFPSQRSN